MTPSDYLKEPYTRILIPDETGGFNAEILEFPGCFAQGETVEGTYKELEEVAESWIEVRLSHGQEIPVPFDNVDYSGTISLRLPKTLHKRAAILADRDKTSLNSFLMAAVATRVGAMDFSHQVTACLEPLATTANQAAAVAVWASTATMMAAHAGGFFTHTLSPVEEARTAGRRMLVSERR
jgi:antitoxin HicB